MLRWDQGGCHRDRVGAANPAGQSGFLEEVALQPREGSSNNAPLFLNLRYYICPPNKLSSFFPYKNYLSKKQKG